MTDSSRTIFARRSIHDDSVQLSVVVFCFFLFFVLFFKFISLLPSVNTLIARGMFCGAKYTHHTFTPVIKHLITTTANKHPGKKSFID